MNFVIDGMHVDVHGDGQLPYLLLVHGFLSNRGQWRPNLAALSQVCTPVTIELLGHGRSGAPTDPATYQVDAYVARFEVLRERLETAAWFICGQSFGAGLTLRYALTHPARVTGQIFTNSVSALSPPMSQGPADQLAALDAGDVAALRAMPYYPRPSKRLPPVVWQEMVDDAALLQPSAIANALRATVPGLSVAADIGRTAVPTLLVNGMREDAFQPFRTLAATEIPGVEIADVDGGHSINLDRADAFDAAVAAFIVQHMPG
ncbi:alpha/beta fold hydrolase [Polymorphobacter arshaanensis]|uniref:Alpha/beta fold hydrolase n=1 Tax=Glacieibacterium arshaanense TaxID=2511025 RepID=A0A4Y9ERG9_9SPHN|nr:alpha/beta fold hydrolase [Polymorphobacter arshaanensis]TFU05498.1 alpha/beta fold hydrolase [Polymorphobacter arshaanensis]